ncbi:MAG TPA: L,D-transpeptidase [Miltoncostaeaceae bacterium]|nr:L,D-transpeptidase [Miltoncostaeaceae bacterium]
MLRRAAVLVVAGWLALAAGCLVLVVAAVASISTSRGPAPLLPSTAGIAGPPPPAFAGPPPRRLDDSVASTRWATLARDAEAHVGPSRESGRVAPLSRLTPEGTDNIVLPFRRALDHEGRAWVEAQIPGLPSRQTGWIERDALGPGGESRARLVVDRERLTLSYVRAGRELLRARIGVGRRDAPTPPGRFYVRNKLTRYASPRYGPLAYGLSARSRLTDWPGGGFIGIHGTDRPDLLPGAVSRGCIRMANADIERLGRLLRVGTPVVIV